MRINTFIVALAFLMLFVPAFSHAQQKKVIDEKVAQVHEKFASELKMENAKLAEVDEIFTDFYTQQERIRENIQKPATTPSLAQGFAGQDFQNVRKQNENIINYRDEKLKRVLSADQFKKWKDEIEPSLRSRR